MTNYQINFFFNEINRPSFFKVKKIKEWISKNLQEYSIENCDINYVFSTDSYVLSINQQFLQHDDYTDIITFDNTINEAHLRGEIYISLERIKENKTQFVTTYQEETLRVMAHGILHLLGYKDKSPEEAKAMRKQEEIWIRNYE